MILQKKNYSNFILTHKYVANILDSIRKSFVSKRKFNLFNIKKDVVLKILHITNFNQRFNGRLHYNTGTRLNNGFIRLGHNVLTISDRDIINKSKNITDYSGKRTLQNAILENHKNFNTDCIVLGHADSVANATLDYLKNINKNLRICQWFLDPLGINGPDYQKNLARIQHKQENLDATFLTTDPAVLKGSLPNSHFIPNPCDKSFETLKNYENNNINDLSYKLAKYKKDHKERKRIAKNGKDFYLKELNSTLVADYILSKTLDYKSKNKFVWSK